MLAPVAHQRIVRATTATLTVTLVDQDGEPAAAAGAVTVRVQKGDGTDLLPAGTATTTGATGVYGVELTAAQTADLNLLTATWTEDGVERAVTLHEIVGGVYFTVAQARARDASITEAKYDAETVRTARTEVEQQCEEICGVAWVPRFARVELDVHAGGWVALPNQQVRSIRSVSSVLSDGSLDAWSADRLAELVAERGLRVGVTSGRLVVEYEHGYDRPPADLVTAAIQHLRHQLNTFTTSSLVDRATQVQTIEGQNLQLATPGRFGFDTGIPTVDAVYQRYDHNIGIA